MSNLLQRSSMSSHVVMVGLSNSVSTEMLSEKPFVRKDDEENADSTILGYSKVPIHVLQVMPLNDNTVLIEYLYFEDVKA